MKILTIVTVTKNCGKTIQKTLNSIKKIKNVNIEYIVVDGISDDGTLEILYDNKDIIDKLIVEKDTGIYNAMNKGAFLAEGDYILFINGDDQIIADNFNSAIEFLSSKKPTILCCKTKAYDPAGNFSTLIARPMHLFFYNSIPHPSTFVLTKLQKKFKFREDLKIASDYDLFLRMYLRFKRFTLLHYYTASHYPGGVSSNVQLSKLEISLIRWKNLGFFVIILDICDDLRKMIKRVILRNKLTLS